MRYHETLWVGSQTFLKRFGWPWNQPMLIVQYENKNREEPSLASIIHAPHDFIRRYPKSISRILTLVIFFCNFDSVKLNEITITNRWWFHTEEIQINNILNYQMQILMSTSNSFLYFFSFSLTSVGCIKIKCASNCVRKKLLITFKRFLWQ